MKKRKFLFIAGLLLMTGISLLFICQQKSDKEEQENSYCLTSDEKQILQEGDIILRHGFGLISDAIIRCLHEKYPVSHCGIIVKDTLGELSVIHTVSNTLAVIDGMQKDYLDVFVKGSYPNSVIVTRYKYENDTLQKKIAEQANYYLLKQIRFDHQFDCSDSTAFFCTEFVWNVFKNAIHVDLCDSSAERSSQCMNFSTFLNPSRFTIILNHHQ
ncbi:MAG: hypothetical protein LBI60_01315 [Bacteroidales bacterium]|jgi:hypothetical protein|nr:hypothetical protein [Bacteroidales bacterium]